MNHTEQASPRALMWVEGEDQQSSLSQRERANLLPVDRSFSKELCTRQAGVSYESIQARSPGETRVCCGGLRSQWVFLLALTGFGLDLHAGRARKMMIKLFILYLTCWNVNPFLLGKFGPIRAELSASWEVFSGIGDGPAPDIPEPCVHQIQWWV